MARQQTLQATVDWSFGLLNRAEQAVLRRLSVFVGGFELEAAEQICATDEVDAFDVADLLGSLVDKSLVLAERTVGSLRYRLLETIRQYAAIELLREGGETEVLRTRDNHADFCLRLAETASSQLTGRRQGEWLRVLDLEWDNLRAAFSHCSAEPARTDDVLRLGVALERFVLSRGHIEMLSYLRAAADASGPEPSQLLASSLVTLSTVVRLLLGQKDDVEFEISKQTAERALTMARALGDVRLEARAVALLSDAAFHDHDPVAAERFGQEAADLSRGLGDLQLLGESLRCLAILPPSLAECRRLRMETLDCFRQTGDGLLASAELYALAGIDLAEGSIGDARVRVAEAIALAEDLGAELFLYFYRSDLLVMLLADGEVAGAEALLRSCLQTARRIGLRLEMAGLLFGSACCATWHHDLRRASQLHGAADAAIAAAVAAGIVRWTPFEEALRSEDQARLRELMGDEGFEIDYRAGAALSGQQAADMAMGRISA
jgi:hypothetical protein